MNEQVVAETIRLFLGGGFLFAMVAWAWQDLRVDGVRQRLFDLRDELFDHAAAGTIPFDHPAYGIMREAINSHIRFAHRMNLMTVILFIVFVRREPLKEFPSYDELLNKHIARLPSDEAKQILESSRLRLRVIVFRHLVISPTAFGLVWVLPVLLMKAIRRAIASLPRVQFSAPIRKEYEDMEARMATNPRTVRVVEEEARAYDESMGLDDFAVAV